VLIFYGKLEVFLLKVKTMCDKISPLKGRYISVLFQSCSIAVEPLLLSAKKIVSDSPGLVDFAIRLVNSVFNLPYRPVVFFEEFD